MHVRLTQIDGKLPNLALMKLARHIIDILRKYGLAALGGGTAAGALSNEKQ